MSTATRTPPVSFPVDVSASGDNEVIPAAPTGFAWHLLGWALSSEGPVTVAVKIGDVAASGFRGETAGGNVCRPSKNWGFPLLHEAAVSLSLDANVAVSGHISAELVPYLDQDAPVLLDGGGASRFDVVEDVYA